MGADGYVGSQGAGIGSTFGGARIKSSSTSWNARHPGLSDRDLDYFVMERQRREFEFEKLRQQQKFEEWKQQMEEERRSAEAHVRRAAEEGRQHLEELRRRMDEERQSEEVSARQAADKETRKLLRAREELEQDKVALMDESQEQRRHWEQRWRLLEYDEDVLSKAFVPLGQSREEAR